MYSYACALILDEDSLPAHAYHGIRCFPHHAQIVPGVFFRHRSVVKVFIDITYESSQVEAAVSAQPREHILCLCWQSLAVQEGLFKVGKLM